MMPNLGRSLKDEIVRLARREIRNQIGSLHRASSGYRRDIAALKRHSAAMERTIKALAKSAGRSAPAAVPAENADKLRFRVDGFKSMRAKLGLSAEQLAVLIGVSPQSVYGWEHGRTTPRRSQLPAIAAVRAMGKREALRRLAEAKPSVSKATAAKRGKRAKKSTKPA